MSILIVFLSIILVIVSILVVFLILVQDDQGEGFGLFGSSGQNPFSTGDNLLSRITAILGIIFFITAFLMALLISRNSVSHSDILKNSGSYLKKSDWLLEKKSPDKKENKTKSEEATASTPQPKAKAKEIETTAEDNNTSN